MAQTIAELEKERAELLKEIETQAQQKSTQRSTSSANTEHTLTDWLSAAEEVMPNSTPKKPASMTKTKEPKNNRSTFFGVVIMLSLLLTILGVVYIAYTAIHNELQKVLEVKENSVSELKVLQETVAELQKSVASGGQGELFEQLVNKVQKLETEVTTLKAQQMIFDKALQNQSVDSAAMPLAATSMTLPSNVVTTEILEQKLQEYTKGLDVKLGALLKHLNVPIPKDMMIKPAAVPEMPAKAEAVQAEEQTESKETVVDKLAKLAEQKIKPKAEPKPEPIQMIKMPEVTVPEIPKVESAKKPLVRMVKQVAPAKAPTEPTTSAPLKNYSADVKWLMDEPAFNHTLQLASMQERSSVQKLIDSKKLQGARIIPQLRNGEDYFVVISGSYESKSEARKAAAMYKADFNISPWIRKMRDITNRVE